MFAATLGPATSRADDSVDPGRERRLELRPAAALLPPDRLQHAGLSFVIAAGVTLAADDARAGWGLTFSLGLFKEWLDSRGGRAEALDLVADAAGASLGSLAARAMRR